MRRFQFCGCWRAWALLYFHLIPNNSKYELDQRISHPGCVSVVWLLRMVTWTSSLQFLMPPQIGNWPTASYPHRHDRDIKQSTIPKESFPQSSGNPADHAQWDVRHLLHHVGHRIITMVSDHDAYCAKWFDSICKAVGLLGWTVGLRFDWNIYHGWTLSDISAAFSSS